MFRASFEEAFAMLEQAIAAFALLGPGALHERTGAELAAGWPAADLGRPADAEARARGVLADYGDTEDTDGTDARSRLAEAGRLLRRRLRLRLRLRLLEKRAGR